MSRISPDERVDHALSLTHQGRQRMVARNPSFGACSCPQATWDDHAHCHCVSCCHCDCTVKPTEPTPYRPALKAA